jgi:SHS2 domain-containing protein
MPARWEHFAHDADVGIRGVGCTPAEAFEQAALALTAVVTDPAAVALDERVEIACADADPEALLFDWLDAVVYEMATRGLVFGRFEVAVRGDRLEASAWGDPVDVAKHQPAVEVKGATYTGLHVRRDGEGAWIAECG